MHGVENHPNYEALAVVDLRHASQKLSDLHAAFASPSANLDDLASSMKTLYKTFERLRLSLQQTNKPFEGYDGFDRMLRDCEIFVQAFKPVKPGKPWTCTSNDVARLEAQIMMQIALLSTANIVLLAETLLNFDSGTIDETTQPAFIGVDRSIDDPELELWEKIQRLIYRRKRKPAPESRHKPNAAVAFEGLEKEVQSQVRQLMLNHQPSISGIASNRVSQHLLDLDSLSDEALLERAQQQQRFLLSASRRTSHQTPWMQQNLPRSNPNDEPEVPRQAKRAQILRNGMISFSLSSRSFRYDLGKIEAKVVEKKRIVHCTTADGDLFITHELPPKNKRHLTTDHPEIGSSSEVYFSETLHVEVKSRFEKIASGDAYICYTFTDADVIRQFQEMVREKDLLHTFCVSKIVSANGEEVSYQHLKVWWDRQTQSCTLTFLRNAAGLDRTYVEFPLSVISLNPAKQPKDSRTVRLGFTSDFSSSPPRNPTWDSMNFARSRRLSGTSSVASFRTDATGATLKQIEKMKSLATSMAFLLVKFTHANDINTFYSALTHHSDPPASLPQPTYTPPLPQTGFPHSPAEEDTNQGHFFSSSPSSISGLTSSITSRRRRQDYTVGWIAALPIELGAAIAMLDDQHTQLSQPSQDSNTYVLGRMGNHNVVIACLPAGLLGISSATSVATQMGFTFPNISIRLMVGIGGGVPGNNHDIRLGDVVVSKPGPRDGAVVQYDFGKTTGEGFEKTGSLPPPPTKLLTAISLLEALHDNEINPLTQYLDRFENRPELTHFRYPGDEHEDLLFKSDYNHVAGQQTCAACDRSQLVHRPPREGRMRIHYGTIASGNQVMKDARTRDILRSKYDVLCFEMESAGLMNMNTFPCVVIRGICDYSDTHKNKEWQSYAAAAAVAYARELLEKISQPSDADTQGLPEDWNTYRSMSSVG